MSKKKTVFFCRECGYETGKWMGRCPGCNAWNSFIEEKVQESKSGRSLSAGGSRTGGHNTKGDRVHSACSLMDIPATRARRILCGIDEFDNLAGGGIVPGSAILIGGEPGIGKSTILLQIADKLAANAKDNAILYVSAEENPAQLKLRAERIGAKTPSLYILSSGNLEEVFLNLEKISPSILVVDSIQAVYSDELQSAPGSVSQIRECAARLVEFCKQENIALFLTGHVTKEGSLAGPKLLEHMVDTVLYFEGQRDQELRILRSVKNRFGNVNEIGVFSMQEQGLQQIHDPSGVFVDSMQAGGPGSALTAALEGNRVIIAELQSLVTEQTHNSITRTIDGVEANRVLRIKALLGQRFHMPLHDQDIFVNVTGGLHIMEPAVDLAIAVAVAGSFRNKTLAENAVFLGEISLLGEIRRINHPQLRVQQAAKLGIPAVMLPEANRDDCRKIQGTDCVFVKTLQDALESAFSG